MAAIKKGGLGRGLDALFADMVPVIEKEHEHEHEHTDTDKLNNITGTKTDIKNEDAGEQVKYIKIHDIMPNANQPRKTFNEEKIAELSKSIIENGIIQPLVVRKKRNGYEIVAGERRWRASMKANLSEVPCLVRELTDEQNMLIAIIENMQREDLNPIEEAEGLSQMMSSFGLTQEEVSQSVGKSRPYIANAIRLLRLPEEIKKQVSNGNISAAHGRTLLSIEDPATREKLCRQIVKEGLSVREVEKIVSEMGKKKKRPAKKREKNPNVISIEEELKELLGTKVVINHTGKKGKIEIEYFSKEELNRLIDLLKTLG